MPIIIYVFNTEEFVVMPRLYNTFPLCCLYIVGKVPKFWAIALGL